MRRSISFTILCFMMLSVLVSCYQSHKRELDLAYTLAESTPDSALVFLNRINQGKLSDKDMAKYALIYYMAQDKSGLDVDNDSLIRIAYDWYGEHQDDSLYASSLYYMGKYYLLNDSMEQAKACLDLSYSISDSLHHLNVKCLALDKLIEVEEQLEPYKALRYAKDLVKMYESMPNVSIYNKVAAHLRLGENFFYVDSLKQALNEEKKAYSLAMSVDDNNLLSYVRQNLASTFVEMGEKDSCLLYARQAYDLNGNDRFSCQLMLASVYISVDSIKQAFAILNEATPKTAEDRYSVFYFQSQAADGGSLLIQFAEQLHYLHTILGIEITRRLIGKDDARLAHHGTGDGNPLLLTARKLMRIMLGTMAQLHLSQYFEHALFALRLSHSEVFQL